MLWTNESYANMYPEERMYMVINNFNQEEMILPEVLCKDRFGDRWLAITRGHDKEFNAYVYNE